MIPREDIPAWRDVHFRRRLEAFVTGDKAAGTLLPWVSRLSSEHQEQLRRELASSLSRTPTTDEMLYWQDIYHILRDWAEKVGWEDLLIEWDRLPSDGLYSIELLAHDAGVLATAGPAVQKTIYSLLIRFLAHDPTAGHLLPRGWLLKLNEPHGWQLRLPDGYRLRYRVDRRERLVRVTYLGRRAYRRTASWREIPRSSLQRRRYGRR